jgi:hypothetical protein
VIRQMRATVSLPIPNRLAIRRVAQCVDPSSGTSCKVSWTTAATFPSGSHNLRPRPDAMRLTHSTPSASKRRRQARTDSLEVWQCLATSFVPTPLPASRSALAWTTVRGPRVVERAITSSAAHCSSVMASGGAFTKLMVPLKPSKLYQRRTI